MILLQVRYSFLFSRKVGTLKGFADTYFSQTEEVYFCAGKKGLFTTPHSMYSNQSPAWPGIQTKPLLTQIPNGQAKTYCIQYIRDKPAAKRTF